MKIDQLPYLVERLTEQGFVYTNSVVQCIFGHNTYTDFERGDVLCTIVTSVRHGKQELLSVFASRGDLEASMSHRNVDEILNFLLLEE